MSRCSKSAHVPKACAGTRASRFVPVTVVSPEKIEVGLEGQHGPRIEAERSRAGGRLRADGDGAGLLERSRIGTRGDAGDREVDRRRAAGVAFVLDVERSLRPLEGLTDQRR